MVPGINLSRSHIISTRVFGISSENKRLPALWTSGFSQMTRNYSTMKARAGPVDREVAFSVHWSTLIVIWLESGFISGTSFLKGEKKRRPGTKESKENVQKNRCYLFMLFIDQIAQ